MTNRQKQLQSEFSRDQHTCNKIWLKLIENCGCSSLLKILTSEILQIAPNDPKPNSRNQASKVPYLYHRLYVHSSTPSPNFCPFRPTISHFQDIAHFGILTPMLKFKSALKVLNFGRSPIYSINFYSIVTTLFIIKFGSDRMKTRGSSVLKFLLPWGPMLTKMK